MPDLAKYRLWSVETPFWEPNYAGFGQIQAPECRNTILGARPRRIWPNTGCGVSKHRLGSLRTPNLAKYRLRSPKTPFGEPKHTRFGQIRPVRMAGPETAKMENIDFPAVRAVQGTSNAPSYIKLFLL